MRRTDGWRDDRNWRERLVDLDVEMRRDDEMNDNLSE